MKRFKMGNLHRQIFQNHPNFLQIFQNKILVNKMGVFNNLQLHDFDIKEYMKSVNEKIQTGFKLDKNNNYDMQQKRLANLAEAVDVADAVTKHQMEVGLANKVDSTSVLLLDGRNHMTGDLDMRGNKIILPGKIDMNRKLITNLATDQNQDLSAVNMTTLKQKVDEKLSKTGGVLSGDLILVQDSFPVQGNTNKAVSYETQREIFLSRQESFPMQTDINLNNNFIQNVATPTSSHQGANKGYGDYNFLNKQKGGVLMGSLSMNQNDLFEIPAPKYGSSAVNKNYVDAKIPSGFVKKTGDVLSGDLDLAGHKITNLPTPSASNEPATKNYVDSKVSGGGGDLDMKNFQIKNLASPTDAKDAIKKKYFDEELLNSHLTSSYIENAFKYLLDQDESSSEQNIIVNGIVEFANSPHKNKKAYSIDLVYTPGTQNYNSLIAINLYPLPIGKYTIILEYYFPEDRNISVGIGSPTAVINKQIATSFNAYKKQLAQFDQQSKDTPDYLYFYIRGSGTTSTNPEGYLVFYGVKEWMDSVPPQIYDHALETGMFSYENGKMKMNMDLDLNGNSLDGISFFIPGWYERAKDTHRIFLNPIHQAQIIPFDCVLNKIVFYIVDDNFPSIRLAIDVTVEGSFYKIYHILTNGRKTIDIVTNVSLNKNDLIKVRFPVIKENVNLSMIDKAVFSFSFSPR